MSDTHNKRVVRIGLDDTDHTEYACTTEHFDRLMRSLSEKLPSFDIIERRLVRLWPFAPERTRGNAALGAICTVETESFSLFENLIQDFFNELRQEIESDYPTDGTLPNPCLVYTTDEFPSEWYWSSVRQLVTPSSRINDLTQFPDTTVLFSKGKSGIVGATAAISWQSKDSSTWELISWRNSQQIGSERGIPAAIIQSLSVKFPSTFANRDPSTGRSLIAPRTNCPVLYGIRGDVADELVSAHEWLQGHDSVEAADSFALHRTNQVSDDHVVGYYESVVLNPPSEKQGGHASVSVLTDNQHSTIVAFAESGHVNKLLRSLKPGDLIQWVGLHSTDGDYHLERLKLVNGVPRLATRPICCGKSMRSAGNEQPLRCLVCGETHEKAWLITPNPDKNTQFNGWVEPSPSNRRHLAKPLHRGFPTPPKSQ